MFMPIASGLFGLIIGSFLNVLILRWGVRPVSGRSACMSCGAVIRWYDLIPVLSWVVLRARCRHCGDAISVQYPLVELATAGLFTLIAMAPVLPTLKVVALPIAALLLAIAVYDLRTTIIPDAWVAICSILALVAAVAGAPTADVSLVPVLLAGPITAAPLFALWYLSRGAWMGLGDVKLALTMGWLLGIQGGLLSLFFAFILGALVCVPLLFLSSELYVRCRRFIQPKFLGKTEGGFTMQSEIPFGPFLVASCFIVWFANMYGIVLTIWDLPV